MTEKEKKIINFYNKIDFDLLKTQKEELHIINDMLVLKKPKDALDGIINMLDDFSDIDYHSKNDAHEKAIKHLPKNIQEILNTADENKDPYKECGRLLELVEKQGYTFEFDLSGTIFNYQEMKGKWAIVETYNGDGYSDPKVSLSDYKEGVTAEMILYGEDYIDFKRKVISKYDWSFDDNENQGRVQAFRLPNDFNIIQIMPDVNDVKVIAHFDNLKDAIKELDILVTGDTFEFEKDDLEEHHENDRDFASHCDKLGFISFKII